MTFIVVLIALLVERFFDWSHLRNWNWFYGLQRSVIGKFPQLSAYVVILLSVIPLLAGLGIIYYFIQGLLYGFITLLLNLFIILYCLGPQNLWADTFGAINQMQQGDTQLAQDKLSATFGIPLTVSDPQLREKVLLDRMFVESHRRVFAIIFWYVLFGFFGVVLYRAVSVANDPTREAVPALGESARKIEGVLDWIPVRIYTFLFALGGHFVQVLSRWQRHLLKGLEDNDLLLAECGNAAIGVTEASMIPEDGSAERHAINLIDRVFILVLVIVALSSFLIW